MAAIAGPDINDVLDGAELYGHIEGLAGDDLVLAAAKFDQQELHPSPARAYKYRFALRRSKAAVRRPNGARQVADRAK